RKGATRAFPAGHELLIGTDYEKTGHPVLIPGSMGTSSAVLMPKDSKKSLYSVNHGCGRVMSRGQARKTLDQEQINKAMDDMDILYNGWNVPIDESLNCYKNINEVLQTVEGAGLAKVITNLRPRAVLKGCD
ncbi:MAG: RtcB family protein, partial [Bacteroidetes bacterium]|nr:RtcB family protein [Bacteroidota bacterium]